MDEIYYVFEAGRPKSVQEGFIFLKHLYLNFVLNFRQRQQITGDRTKEKKIKKKRKKRKEGKKEKIKIMLIQQPAQLATQLILLMSQIKYFLYLVM